MYERDSQNAQATIADMSSTGDKVTLTPVVPIEIVSIGFIVTTVLADAAGGAVLKCDKRITAGSDTGRGNGDLGTLTLTQAQADAMAPGEVARSRVGAASGAFAGAAPVESAYVVYPGEQAILELTTGVDSGAAIGFIEFKPYQKPDSSEETVVTS